MSQSTSQPPAVVAPSTFNNFFLYGAICVAVGAPLTLILVGIPVLIAGAVLLAILLYRAWSILPEDEARTQPMLAVALCFVPLFNLFWNFIAFWGLTKDLNAHLAKHDIQGPRANETLALISCILVPLGFIPFLGLFILWPASIVLGLIAFKSVKDAAVAIVESRGVTDPAPAA